MHTTHLMTILIIIASGGILGILLTVLPLNRFAKFLNKGKKIVRTEPKLGIAQLKHAFVNHSNTYIPKVSSHVLREKQQEFLVLYLMAAKDHCFKGYQLWEALMDAKLSYGEMQIFHAYDKHNSKIVFSIAGAIEPGYFNVHHIEDMQVPGLCLFMKKEKTIDTLQVFEGMMHAARQLRDALGGSLYDSDKKLLTEDQISYYQSQISSD